MSVRGVRVRRRLLLALAVLAAVPVAGFGWFLAAAAALPTEPLRHTDGIAVLTGGAERVETGLRLLREGRADRLIVSGVHPDVTLADLARRPVPYRAALPADGSGTAPADGDLALRGDQGDDRGDHRAGNPGADPARVTLGRTATTTRGNALEIAAWARASGVRSIRVVTAGYHMPRATLELRRALPEATLLPHPVMPARLRDAGAASRLRTWSLLFGEYLKWIGAAAGLASPAGAAEPPSMMPTP